MIEQAIENAISKTQKDGLDKFLDDKFGVEESLENKLSFEKEQIQQEISSLKEQISNIENNIQAISNEVVEKKVEEVKLELQTQILTIMQDTINSFIHLLQKMGLDIEEIKIDSIDELESELKKLNSQIDKLNFNQQKLSNILNKEQLHLQKLDYEEEKVSKKIEFVENSPIIKSIDEMIKNYNLTEDDKEAIIEVEKEILKKLDNLDLEDFQKDAILKALNYTLIDIKKELENELEDIDINWGDVAENALMSAGISAGVGSFVPGLGTFGGAVTGFVSGVMGEIGKQLAVQMGAGEPVATGLQIGIEMLTPGGIIKLMEKNLLKEGLTLGDDVLKIGDKLGERISDSLLRLEYRAKGILNDMKVYEFVDKEGNVIFRGKIKDILGEETIKMPYIGSNAEKANAAGYLRDAKYFGEEFMKKYPEMLSEENKALIKAGKSPIVDEVWIKYHPNQKAFLGEKLEHHHINNLGEAVYVPQSLHRGKINKDILHVDNDNVLDSTIEVIKQKLEKGQA